MYIQNQCLKSLVGHYVDKRTAGVTVMLLGGAQHLWCAIIVVQLGILCANIHSNLTAASTQSVNNNER